MKDYYLVFKSENEMKLALIERGFVSEDNKLYKENVLMDEIGHVYEKTGEVTIDESGSESDVMKPIKGYFVNLRVLDDDTSAFDTLPISEVQHRAWAD